jgi:hypothetical protein
VHRNQPANAAEQIEKDLPGGESLSPYKAAERVLFRGEMWDGRKTNNFYINLMRNVDPEGKGHPDNMGVTIDVHIMRASVSAIGDSLPPVAYCVDHG